MVIQELELMVRASVLFETPSVRFELTDWQRNILWAVVAGAPYRGVDLLRESQAILEEAQKAGIPSPTAHGLLWGIC